VIKHKRTSFRRAAAVDTGLKAATATDKLQDTCDRRMAEANAANAPKEPLFHYTKEKALFSILDTGHFWFTSIYHMDDPKELNFGFEVACKSFDQASKRRKGLARRFFQTLAQGADREKIRELIAFYSVSFGLRDVEKQWIKYADEGRDA
jgi:hypothetical protein